jgi:hypothetical protein
MSEIDKLSQIHAQVCTDHFNSTWRDWFQNAINAKSKISELTTPWYCTNKEL